MNFGQSHTPDGTVIWTAPKGRTHPGSRIYFPAWNVIMAEFPDALAPQAISSITAIGA